MLAAAVFGDDGDGEVWLKKRFVQDQTVGQAQADTLLVVTCADGAFAWPQCIRCTTAASETDLLLLACA